MLTHVHSRVFFYLQSRLPVFDKNGIGHATKRRDDKSNQ